MHRDPNIKKAVALCVKGADMVFRSMGMELFCRCRTLLGGGNFLLGQEKERRKHL